MAIDKNEYLKQFFKGEFIYLVQIFEKVDDTDVSICNLTNASDDIVYNNVTYQKSLFTIKPPEVTSTSIGNATITVSSVDQTIVKEIRKPKKKYYIKFVGVVDSWDGDHLVEPIFDNEFILRNAVWNDISITWTMVFDDNQDILIPCQICTTDSTPGVE